LKSAGVRRAEVRSIDLSISSPDRHFPEAIQLTFGWYAEVLEAGLGSVAVCGSKGGVMRVQGNKLAAAVALSALSAASFAAGSKFKVGGLAGTGSIDQEYVDQFPYSYCARGDQATNLAATVAATQKIAIKSVDCQHVSAPVIGLLSLDQYQNLIQHGAQSEANFKNVAWRHGLTGWRVPTEGELFYAADQGYLRPGFWYAAKSNDGNINKWRLQASGPMAGDQVMPLYVRDGVGSATNSKLVIGDIPCPPLPVPRPGAAIYSTLSWPVGTIWEAKAGNHGNSLEIDPSTRPDWKMNASATHVIGDKGRTGGTVGGKIIVRFRTTVTGGILLTNIGTLLGSYINREDHEWFDPLFMPPQNFSGSQYVRNWTVEFPMDAPANHTFGIVFHSDPPRTLYPDWQGHGVTIECLSFEY